MNLNVFFRPFAILAGLIFTLGMPACSNVTPTVGVSTPTVEVNAPVREGKIAPTARASSVRPTATPAPSAGAAQTPPPPTLIPAVPARTPTPTPTPAPKDEQESDRGVSLTDRDILIELFESTDGRDWHHGRHSDSRENWLTDADIGLWTGVTTNDQGRVTRLDLAGIFMDGPIPASLGSLDQLEVLNFSRNYVSGTIPKELGNLANLQELDLSGNDIGGEIPAELGRLGNLKTLDLNGNDLWGNIPPELGNLDNLERLDFSSNALRGLIPTEFGNLTKLEILDLAWNELGGTLSPGLGNMISLKTIRLFENQLVGPIPETFGNLLALNELNFDDNYLEGTIPAVFGNLVKLEILSIERNQLTGEIPPELGNLTRLEELLIAGNDLTGEIPPELSNLFKVREIRLWGNPFSGCIPWTLSIHYYLGEDLELPFCDPPQALSDGPEETSDYLGPSMQYLDPILWSALYSHQVSATSAGSLRVGIGRGFESEDSDETPIMDAYIRSGGGVFVGDDWDYVWEIPVPFIPKVICRPEVYLAVLVEEDGTLSLDHVDKAYENIPDALNHILLAYRSGVPAEEAVLYAMFVRGDKIATHIRTETVSLADEIRAWLGSRDIYTIPPDSYYQEHPSVSVLLPVRLFEPLAEQFPDAWISVEDFDGQGPPMLRSQWPAEVLAYETFMLQALLDPDSDIGPLIPGQGLRPCSP